MLVIQSHWSPQNAGTVLMDERQRKMFLRVKSKHQHHQVNEINALITLSALWLWCWRWFKGVFHLGRLVCLYGSRQGWRWSVFEGLEVVDDVVSNQRAATEGPPINNSDTERRMEVFVLW